MSKLFSRDIEKEQYLCYNNADLLEKVMSGFVNYVNNMPEPLSREEQNVLLRNYCVTKNEEVREVLITHNLRLVAKVVLEFAGKWDLDDLMQIGTIEFMRVLDKYDISKGIEFSTYAYACVRGRLINEINSSRRLKNALFQDCASVIDYHNLEGETDNIFDHLSFQDTFVNDVTEKDTFDRFLKTLNERNRYILEHSLGLFGSEKLTIKEMSEALCCGESVISLSLNKLLTQLRMYYLNGGQFVEEQDNEEVKAIKEYISECQNPEHIVVLEHLYGINGKEKLSGTEISRRLGRNLSYATQILNRVIRQKNIVREQEIVPIDDILNLISCSRNEKEILVLEYSYGLNGKEKLPRKKIMEILNISQSNIIKIIIDAKKKITKKKQVESFNGNAKEIPITMIAQYVDTMTNEKHKLILEYYYGLNGREKLQAQQIAPIVNLSGPTIYRIVLRVKDKIRESVEQDTLIH